VEHLAFDVNQITFGLLVLICRLVKSLMWQQKYMFQLSFKWRQNVKVKP
jgi:hypothetical protein